LRQPDAPAASAGRPPLCGLAAGRRRQDTEGYHFGASGGGGGSAIRFLGKLRDKTKPAKGANFGAACIQTPAPRHLSEERAFNLSCNQQYLALKDSKTAAN
jgi:hypothetical protein